MITYPPISTGSFLTAANTGTFVTTNNTGAFVTVNNTGSFSTKSIRANEFAVIITDTAVFVPFATNMANTGYQVTLIGNGLAGALTTSNKTISGFTSNMSVGINGTIGYVAISH